ncbi:MAG: flagellar motor protein [Deltaproteobacteria bacterium]|nr:flagellar motor protein [Deltaproteobacteria bacterium]
MDFGTIGGVVLSIACILFGQALEGGHAGSLVQATAAIIVLGGTAGATIVGFPVPVLKKGVGMIKDALQARRSDLPQLVTGLVELAGLARRDGVLALESRINTIDDPFMKKGLRLVVDGVDAKLTRDTLEAEIYAEFEENLVAAKVFESAGGFAPTVGILGAVLGLIHVMENLSDPSKLGGGIATAFVATVYGVGIANLILLPLANKLKVKVGQAKERKILIAEGILSIQEGVNPRVLEEKLHALTGGHVPHAAKAGG